MYGNLFVNTQISANFRNKLQEYTQSPDKITQKYERIHSFTKRTVRSFRKFEVREVNINGISPNMVCALILWISGLGLLRPKKINY